MHKISYFVLSALLISCGGKTSYSVTPVTNGTNGSNCSVSPISGGALVACSDGTYAMIADGARGTDGTNGSDGSNGADAPINPYDIVEIIDPCGDGPGYDEVLLRFRNGLLLAHYASGANQFFTILSPGSYVSTDGQSCSFSINTDKQIVY